MPEPMTTNSHRTLVSRLREATAGMHSNLEKTALSRSLLAPGVTLADYKKYLLAMKEVISFAEENVFPLLGNVIPDIPERYKTRLIDSDLSFLKKILPATTGGRYNASPAAIHNMAFALGFMYVIEGSTLGGIYILKHLSAALNIDEKSGASFFYGYGKATGKRWNDFLSAMQAGAATDRDVRDITDGAVYAFSSITHFFESIEA